MTRRDGMRLRTGTAPVRRNVNPSEVAMAADVLDTLRAMWRRDAARANRDAAALAAANRLCAYVRDARRDGIALPPFLTDAADHYHAALMRARSAEADAAVSAAASGYDGHAA